ncbi:MAG: hypothetical protein F6J92_38665 [Symploca sp. SIO1A3]|nr:hypothetical protein [Symploca sp. SIO1A3]
MPFNPNIPIKTRPDATPIHPIHCQINQQAIAFSTSIVSDTSPINNLAAINQQKYPEFGALRCALSGASRRVYTPYCLYRLLWEQVPSL